MSNDIREIHGVHSRLFGDVELFENVVEQAGRYSGKYNSNVSLAAHIINATVVGVNCFAFEAVVQGGKEISDVEPELRMLTAALVLHDTNKYVNEKHGWNAERNSDEVFERYWEDDDFGVEEFLGDGDRETLQYLVQRCEIKEDSRETRKADIDKRFRGLERYCRLGDATASAILREGVEAGYEYLESHFSISDPNPVQLVEFTALEQPVLTDQLIGAVKSVLAGTADDADRTGIGVVLGSTDDAVLYLGEEVERDRLRDRVRDQLEQQILHDFDFGCKLNWNSFDYDILSEISLAPERKEAIIADEFRALLERGSAGVEGFEHIPEAFDEYFPTLAKAVYLDGRSSFDDESIQSAYDQIRDEQGVQKVKLHFVAYLLRTYPEHDEFLDDLTEEIRPELHNDLEPENDAIGAVIERFFEGTPTGSLASKDQTCFLCGGRAEAKYQKGARAVYRTQEYSRRVPPHEKYKSICGTCNLEYALFADICARSDVSTANNVEVAYFYFDEFLGDVRLREERAGSLIQGETMDMDDTDLFVQLTRPQYYVQPFYVIDQNHRMQVVRRIMETVRETGMKVAIGRPFTRFDAGTAVVTDEEATRPQTLLGLDSVERFEQLDRPLALFKIMSMVGREADMNNPYLQLDRDTFHDLAHFVVVNHSNATGLSDVRSYIETYHETAYMQMRTVAERGVDLFGTQYDSKYKKTKIFREALDAFLSGQSQGMDGDDLLDYVESQVYVAAQREDYAGAVTTAQAERFVEAIHTYLVENDLYELKKLSDWEDALVNSYFYAYDQLLNDQ
jgi:CRISPR-associated protein Csc3